VSLRLDMLRAAANARRRRPDVAEGVGRFLQSAAMPDGGFAGRGPASDLYYTVFGMQTMTALDAPAPADARRAYLEFFGDGAALDFVHLACLARCWALVPGGAPAQVRRAIGRRLETCRAADGGYHPTPGAAAGTAYAGFLAVGACQDVETPLPDPAGLVRGLDSLRADDGGYANLPAMPRSSTPATAAAIVALAELGESVDPAATAWLAGQMDSDGGWRAVPAAPIADLLSTATALHALATAGAALDDIRRPCRRFVESLWTDEGGFRGHWADDHVDCEYTFYGLLALGHLLD